MSTGSRAVDHGCVHTAVLYHSEEEYLDLVKTSVLEGLAKGESTWVAISAAKIDSLRDALHAAGAAVDDVTFADITQLGRNPGRILGLAVAFADQHPDQPVRMLGEPVWPGRSAVEYPACLQLE